MKDKIELSPTERLLKAIFGDDYKGEESFCACGQEILCYVDGKGYCKECLIEVHAKEE